MELADPDLKSMIEKQIISTAYQALGDFHNKILLSLPPEKKAKGSINLGTVIYDKEKWPLGLKYGELIQNAAILGRSGAGKTNVTFHILSQLIEKNIPFVFMDWKRTVRHLIPNFKDKLNIYTPGRTLSKFPFNPFVVPPGIESNVYVNQLVDVMSQAFTLGDGSRSILRKAIASLYAKGNLCPTVADIIKELEKVPDTGRQGGWKLTAMRALDTHCGGTDNQSPHGCGIPLCRDCAEHEKMSDGTNLPLCSSCFGKYSRKKIWGNVTKMLPELEIGFED